MPAPLKLTKDSLACQLALEVLDRPLDALVANGDLYGLTLNCVSNTHIYSLLHVGWRKVAQQTQERKRFVQLSSKCREALAPAPNTLCSHFKTSP